MTATSSTAGAARSRAWLAGLTALVAIAYSLFTLYTSGVRSLFNMEQMVIHLGFGLLLVFITHPVHPRAPWPVDAAVSLAGIAAAGAGLWNLYVGWTGGTIMMRLGDPTPFDVWAGSALILAVLEACRRLTGWVLPALALACIGYAMVDWLPGPLAHRAFDLAAIVNHLYLANEGLFGVPLNVSSTTVGVFMVLSAFLVGSGAGQLFVDVAVAAFGRFRGGSAKAAVLASGLFGMVSGSAVANTVTVGSFTIPLLKRSNAQPHMAAAIEGAASIGGQLAPPIMGAAAFIMADILAIPYIQVAAAAAIPAFLYYCALFWMVDGIATRYDIGNVRKAEVRPIAVVVREQGHLVLPFVVLVLLAIILDRSIGQAGFWAVVATLVVSGLRRSTRMGPAKIVEALRAGGLGIVQIAVLTACVGVIVGMISMTGLGILFSSLVTNLAGGNLLGTLALGAIAALILGTGLPTVPTYIVLAVVLAPALVAQGVPALAAHMFIFYFGVVSDLTPPTALAPVTAAGIAGADPWKTMNTAFLLGGNGYLLPFMFALSPAFLLAGSLPSIVLAVGIGIVETTALAAVVTGYLMGRAIGGPERFLLLVAAIVLVYPSTWTYAAGLALAAVAWTSVRLRGRQGRGEPAQRN